MAEYFYDRNGNKTHAWNESRQEWEPVARTGVGTLRQITQGGLFGWADEIDSAAQAAQQKLQGSEQPFGDLYRQNQNAYADEQRRFANQHPALSLGSEMLGGLTTGLVGGAKVAPTLMAKQSPLLTSNLMAGGGGALYGAGKAATVEDIPTEAAIGGGLGMGLNTVTYPLANWLARTGSKMFQRPQMTTEGIAGRKVGEALQRDEMTIDDAIKRQTEMGPMARLVDAGEANVMDLAESVANMPGRTKALARTFLTDRQEQQFSRMMGDVRRTLGNDGKYIGTYREMAQQRAKEAGPLYRLANDKNVDPSVIQFISDRLESLAAQSEGTGIGRSIRNANRMLFKTVNGERVPKTNVGRELHTVKMELDDQIGKAIRQGENAKAKALLGIKSDLLDAMEQASPDYRKAREMFAGDSALLNAMEAGKKVLREDAEELVYTIEKMSQSEKDAYLIGATKAIRDKLASVGDRQNAAMRIAGNPAMRERLRPLFDNEAGFEDFMQAMAREEKFTEVKNRLLANSRTQPRQEATNDLADLGAELATGDKAGAIVRFLRNAKESMGRKQQMPDQVRAELGRLLFEAGPDELRRVLRQGGMTPQEIDGVVNKIGTMWSGAIPSIVGANSE